MIENHCPDLAFFSEANLYPSTTEAERQIPGYTIVTTVDFRMGFNSRLVLLVREGFNVNIEQDLMEADIASIWTTIPRRGTKKLRVGGVYREHQLIGRSEQVDTSTIECWNSKWNRYLRQWETAADRDTEVIVIGDTNLDIEKWESPDKGTEHMTIETQNRIETWGFVQLVRGATRFWPQLEDSLVDQVWTNVDNKVIQCKHIVRVVGDHTILEVLFRLKGSQLRPQEVLKRNRKNFSEEMYKQEVMKLDWSQLYEETDPNLAYYLFETKIGDLLDSMVPYKVTQVRKSYKNWLSEETKEVMKERNFARKKARQ